MCFFPSFLFHPHAANFHLPAHQDVRGCFTEKVVFPELSVCFINAAKMTRKEGKEEVEVGGDKRMSSFMVSYHRVTILFTVAFASCHGIPLSLYPGGVFLI